MESRVMKPYRDENGDIYFSYPNLNGYERSRLNYRQEQFVMERQDDLCAHCGRHLTVGVFSKVEVYSLKTKVTRIEDRLSYITDVEFHHVISVKEINNCENLRMKQSIDTVDNFQAVHKKCHLRIHGKQIAGAAVS